MSQDPTQDNAGWLLLTESAGMNYFKEFRATAGRYPATRWKFHRTEETDSLIAQSHTNARLLLIAGRQVVTAEGLEILALCCDRDFVDGAPLRATVQAVKAVGAVAVLPWGYGKWWFRRRTQIAEFVRSVRPTDVFLGDNGGRLPLGFRPRPFRIAESRGIEILSGTDPLPLDSEVKRVGGYGFVIDGRIAISRPAAGMRHLLRTGPNRPMPYGDAISPIAFCRNQLLLRAAYGPSHRAARGPGQRSTYS